MVAVIVELTALVVIGDDGGHVGNVAASYSR